MHFSATSQLNKICFDYQGIIFQGETLETFQKAIGPNQLTNCRNSQDPIPLLLLPLIINVTNNQSSSFFSGLESEVWLQPWVRCWWQSLWLQMMLVRGSNDGWGLGRVRCSSSSLMGRPPLPFHCEPLATKTNCRVRPAIKTSSAITQPACLRNNVGRQLTNQTTSQQFSYSTTWLRT